MRVDSLADTLLAWYDAHARVLPWRTPPGSTVAPDPYTVWLSEIMLQQTTVATVRARFAAFVARWPTVAALAAADDAQVMRQWAGLGYYARARNLLAGARAVVRDHGGVFPRSEAGLRTLPGVGAYTAAAIAAIAFGARAVVIDGNVERVAARLHALTTPLPAARALIRPLVDAMTPVARAGDFAQALMDLASSICTPRAPACLACPLNARCAAYASGDPARFPIRPAKPVRPTRRGTAWWIEADGDVLLVTRPARGLLGGMVALPSTGWSDGDAVLAVEPGAPLGSIAHAFTHFALTLDVVRARLAPGCVLPDAARWWPATSLAAAGLPTVFAKAARLAQGDKG